MMHFILHTLVSGVAVALTAWILPNVTVKNFWTAIWVGLLIGLADATLGKVLHFLTLPLNWLTLGVLGFVIDVIIIMLVDKLVAGFKIKNFLWTAIFAFLCSLISGLLHKWIA